MNKLDDPLGIDKKLLDFLNDREAEKREGITLRRLGAQLEDSRDQNRREHDEFRRRHAEHGRRIGALEVNQEAIERRLTKTQEEIEEVEEDSKSWMMNELTQKVKSHHDQEVWWKRQWVLWVVGAGMAVLGAALSLFVALIVYFLEHK